MLIRGAFPKWLIRSYKICRHFLDDCIIWTLNFRHLADIYCQRSHTVTYSYVYVSWLKILDTGLPVCVFVILFEIYYISKRFIESLKYIFFHCILFVGSLGTVYNVLINAFLSTGLLCWPRRSDRLIVSYTRRVPATLLPERCYAAINLLRLRMYQLASFHEWFSGYFDCYSDNCNFRYRSSFNRNSSILAHKLIFAS